MQKIIVGIDEAGRGPLAGPVIACAITLPQFSISNSQFSNLKDSKLLSPRQREAAYLFLEQHPDVHWGVGRVSEKQIDKINIYQATRLAMKKAFQSLSRKLQKRGVEPELLIVDGTSLIDVAISQKAIIKADATILQCMAASIIAKVTRDRLMLRLHQKYPLYGFDRHKGYGTPQHLEMLRLHGPCAIHRLSFAPCQPKVDKIQR